MKPYIVAVFNQKGGISKTTTSTNLAVCLAAYGKTVVVIDLDSQGDSTKSMGIDPNVKRGIYDLFVGNAEVNDIIIPTPFENVRILPSTYSLAGIEIRLSELKDSQRTLVHILSRLELDADYVIVDCPPALGILPINALAAAQAVIIPVTATPYANDGLMRTLPSIKYVQEGLNKSLLLQGVLFTINDNNKTTRKINDLIRHRLGGTVYRTEIPRDNMVIEAATARLPVCIYDPHSPAALAHLDFTGEMLDRHIKIAAKASITLPPVCPREQALANLERWSERHMVNVDRPTGDRLRQKKAQLDRLLYGDRTPFERFHLDVIHFFIDNRLYLVAFIAAVFLLVGILLGMGVGGVKMLLQATGLM
ncbi:MAG: ParA family protein [Magnetospirillum sp.]|nr:ParA family protein [Magnetospirillum sp.]